jgi:S1-C subfamily serine protease
MGASAATIGVVVTLMATGTSGTVVPTTGHTRVAARAVTRSPSPSVVAAQPAPGAPAPIDTSPAAPPPLQPSSPTPARLPGTQPAPERRAAVRAVVVPPAVPRYVATGDPVTQALVNIVAVRADGSATAATGQVLTPAGLVLTNHHVIEEATSITAQLGGGGPVYRATVVGSDLSDDVAVVQLQYAAGLPTLALGDSSGLAVGDPVLAVGNAGGRSGVPTVTSGSVIDTGRSIVVVDPGHASETLNDTIVFNADVEVGDSGGPLVSSTGDVVGLITAGVAGGPDRPPTGYAIPIETALNSVRLIEAG